MVLTPLRVASADRAFCEWPRGFGWLSGASPLLDHGSLVPARWVSISPTTQTIAMRTTSGESRATTRSLGSCVPMMTTTRTARTTAPSMTSVRLAAW